MEAKRYALIEDATGKCVNVILWDGKTSWAPPEGFSVVADETRDVEQPDLPPTPDEIKKAEHVETLKSKLVDLGLSTDEIEILTGDSK